jgi:DNA-binding GntR family transcriptional regulator
MAKPTPTTRVYENLKERIEQGYYSPAESLPEIELATEYDVSRNTIKKALLMLENDALVNIEPNRGAKVRSYSKTEVLEFVELREELEGFIIRNATPVFRDESLKKMEALLKQMKEYKENSNLMEYSACNRQFHSIIYENCPNRTAVEITVRLKNQMRKYNSKTILVPGRDEQSLKEHQAIYEALKKREPALAEQCIRAHMQNVRKTFEEYYSLLF